VALGTERGFVSLNAALHSLPGLRLSVEAAKANQAQAEARFRAGLGNIVELADAENLLTRAELELAVGLFGVARARAALGRAMGQTVVATQRKGP
jgi:outer membrane protein